MRQPRLGQRGHCAGQRLCARKSRLGLGQRRPGGFERVHCLRQRVQSAPAARQFSHGRQRIHRQLPRGCHFYGHIHQLRRLRQVRPEARGSAEQRRDPQEGPAGRARFGQVRAQAGDVGLRGGQRSERGGGEDAL